MPQQQMTEAEAFVEEYRVKETKPMTTIRNRKLPAIDLESKQTQHTPGPWFARKRDNDKSRGWEVRQLTEDYDAETDSWGKAVAPAVTGWGSVTQTEANARLIAAAPDLLAALKALVKVEDEESQFITAEWDAARAAIAKAEGRAQ